MLNIKDTVEEINDMAIIRMSLLQEMIDEIIELRGVIEKTLLSVVDVPGMETSGVPDLLRKALSDPSTHDNGSS